MAGNVIAVATHSSGNHGTAVALAAKSLRPSMLTSLCHAIPPRPKIANIEQGRSGVDLLRAGLPAREAALAEGDKENRRPSRSPIRRRKSDCRQGTATLELLAEEPDLDVICTPIGGGGLIGGTALAAKAMAPRCRVIGAEPQMADDAYRSFKTGKRLSVTTPQP